VAGWNEVLEAENVNRLPILEIHDVLQGKEKSSCPWVHEGTVSVSRLLEGRGGGRGRYPATSIVEILFGCGSI
jgi:hypothetical protein